MRRQIKVAEGALSEIGKAADAAKRSAEIAEKALVLTNRAYLNPEGWEYRVKPGEIKKRLDIWCVFKNKGSYPATIKLITVSQPVPCFEQKADIMVYPDTGYRFCIPDTLTEYEVKRAPLTVTRVIIGKVRYCDGFVIRDRQFHRVLQVGPDETTFHIPDSALNNEEEVKDKD